MELGGLYDKSFSFPLPWRGKSLSSGGPETMRTYQQQPVVELFFARRSAGQGPKQGYAENGYKIIFSSPGNV
jgi:hypothetical protein